MFRSLASVLFATAVSAGYADYTLNGANWGGLCAHGVEQSPIDLTDDTVPSNKMEVVGYNYYDFKVNSSFKPEDVTFTTAFDIDALRTNAELQLTFADGSQSYFTPLQFHFHAPSEHTVDGKLLDLEVHFVHVVKGSESIDG
jgi:carbonic anhydrase